MMYPILVLLFGVAFAAYEPDLVKDLPGADGTLDYTQYSGYLNGSDDGNIQLHYWFVTAQNDPDTAPLVLWLNGGPGCSSMDGMLYEHGPQLVADESGDTLKSNKFAWNQIANMIYLESPACVGYSYAKDGNCTVDDDGTSLENYNALLSFLDKFPEYKDRPLFITGESYGGIYVPTLTYRIFESDSVLKDNLVAFATGNGLLSNPNNTNSLITFAYTHGIISDEMYEDLLGDCCDDLGPHCDFTHGSSFGCTLNVGKALSKIYGNPNLNVYDVIDKCFHDPSQAVSKGDALKYKRALEMMMGGASENKYLDKYLELSDSEVVVPCVNSVGATNYMNRDDVKQALHIADGLPEWEICSTFDYKKTYDTMHSQFETLLKGGIRALVYHGDVDAACNFLGGAWFVHGLGLDPQDDYHTWVLDGQIGGWWQNYGNILQYTTVRGAGHTVPQYKPAHSLYMFSSFIDNHYD